MIHVVKIDKNNYFVDHETGEKVYQYNPDMNLDLVLTLNKSKLNIDKDSIIREYGGNLVVRYLNDKYIIDDGYQSTLVKAGYIVYKNYDTEYIDDYNFGVEVRRNIIDDLRYALKELDYFFEVNNLETECVLIINGFEYKIKFETVGSIVAKNNKRRDNNLIYYPFDKAMDKFGTMYISIFAEKIDGKEKNKYEFPNNFIQKLICVLGLEYHFVSVPIKGRLLHWEGL